MQRHLLNFLLILTVSTAFGQFRSYQKIDQSDGLQASLVYDCIQDRKGIIWLATDGGVVKFDGIRFKYIPKALEATMNEPLHLVVDSSNRIWARSLDGSISYIQNDSAHYLYRHNDLRTSPSPISRDRILFPDSTSLIVRNEALDIHSKIELGAMAHNYLVDRDGKVLIQANRVYSLVDVESGGIDTLPNFKTIPASHKSFYCTPKFSIVVQRDKNEIYVSPRFSDEQRQQFPCPIKNLDEVSTDGDNLWLSSRDNEIIYKMSLLTGKVIDSIRIEGTRGTVYPDNEENLWVGSFEGALFFFPNERFIHFSDNNAPNYAYSIEIIDDKLWIGDYTGRIHRRDGNKFTSWKVGDKKITGIFKYNDKLLASEEYRLYEVDTKNDKVRIIKNSSGEDVQGRKILKVDSQLFTISTKRVNIYTSDLESHRSVYEFKRSRALELREADSSIWVAHQNGIGVYKSGDIFKFSSQIADFPGGRHYDLKFIRGDKMMCTATDGHGLILYDFDKDGFTTINTTDGLSHNICRVIYPESDTVLWVGTINGLNRVTLSQSDGTLVAIEPFYTTNGLSSNYICDVKVWRDTVWVGTDKGLDCFVYNPSSKASPAVYLQEVLANNQALNNSSGEKLSYRQNTLAFAYTGVSFSSMGNLQFEYKLDGVDKDWVRTRQTRIRYPGLKAGDYTFQVRAISSKGIKSPEAASFFFSITPAFWNTLWFNLAAIFFSLFLLVTIYMIQRKRRIAKSRNEKIQNLRVAKLELEALQAQMNPHFIFNSMNAIQKFILKSDDYSANKYLTDFAKLMRGFLEASHSKYIALDKEVELLKQYISLEQLRFEDRFNFEIEIEKEVSREIEIPSLVIQPFVENAINHGLAGQSRGGYLYLGLSKREGSIHIVVDDNGIGRKQASKNTMRNPRGHVSRGMKIVHERLDILSRLEGSNIRIQTIDKASPSGQALGTRVEIEIPIS